MRRWRQRSILAAAPLTLSLVACATDAGPGGGNPPDPDAGAPLPDGGAPPPPPDGGAPADPDAGPAPVTYPPGPYGTTVGSTISNRMWRGYMDTNADADQDPFNEPPHEITLADFYRGNDSRSRLLLIDQSAGWCGPCQEEAAVMATSAPRWMPRGIRFLTAMWQDLDGNPGSTDYAATWGHMFGLTTPVVADPDDLAGTEFGGNAIPFFILIDTSTMKIVDFPQVGIADLESTFEMYAD